MLANQQRLEVLEFCQQLIRIPSVGPNEKEIVQYIADKMVKLGYEEVVIDEVGNVIGKFSGVNKKSSLLFDGHVDTVGVTDPEQWAADPFGGVVKDGRIYGRGAADMKASIAAAVCGAAFLIKQGFKPQGDLYICCSISEELIEGAALNQVLKKYQPKYVIIGEATDLKLNIGQRGRAEILVECLGKQAHSSQPFLGINALKLMARLLTDIEDMELPRDAELGPAIIEPTDIISRPYPGLSVIPDSCKVTFDRRLLTGEKPEDVIKQVESVIQVLQKQDSCFNAQVSLAEAEFTTHNGYPLKAPKFAPAWKLDPNHPLVQVGLEALSAVGIKPEIGYYAFCTNGSYPAGKMGIPTIGFGIGHEDQAHQRDEWVKLDDLFRGTSGYMSIIKYLLS
ncbi:MAG: YgeY family selenium metabolism-linked hydrolase [Bacillota bacterium]